MAYRFGPFQLDPRTGTLSGPEGPIPLRRQAFRLAEVLLERAPELLDHHTLLDSVWGRTALSANALTQTISELRHALGDDAHHPRYIETVHRRGYRVVCRVESTLDSRIPSMPPARRVRPALTSRDLAKIGAMLLAVALVVASAPAPSTNAAGKMHAHADAQPPGFELPQALLRMCAQLPGSTDSGHTPAASPFAETLGQHAPGMPQENPPTCLPAP